MRRKIYFFTFVVGRLMKGLKVFGEGFSNGYRNKKIFIVNSKYNLVASFLTLFNPPTSKQRNNCPTIIGMDSQLRDRYNKKSSMPYLVFPTNLKLMY